MKNKRAPCEHVIGERQRELITQNKSVISNLKFPKIESVTSKKNGGSNKNKKKKDNVRFHENKLTRDVQ